MSDDLIRYDILTQEALRRVIRKVLEEVQRTGLPGEHHFFITFETGYPGVRLSARMRERYPEEMTIVIQHSYWNLEVDENCLEIDLSFDDIRERLRVPFAAIRGFFDPAVKFGLQFDVEQQAEEKSAEGDDATPITPTKSKNKKSGKTLAPASDAEDKPDSSDAEETDKPDSGGDVVSLDSFRKKKWLSGSINVWIPRCRGFPDANWSALLKKHSITIRGHRTSFSIEDEFHGELLALAESENKPLARLVSQIDDQRSPDTNLSSAIRLYVLKALKTRISDGDSDL